MTQKIDPEALQASAEHLEWVLRQYPNEPEVVGLLRELMPLIDAAKSGRVEEPVARYDIPGRHNSGSGLYAPYADPDVESAYVKFAVQMQGGYTQQELDILAQMARNRQNQPEQPADG